MPQDDPRQDKREHDQDHGVEAKHPDQKIKDQKQNYSQNNHQNYIHTDIIRA